MRLICTLLAACCAQAALADEPTETAALEQQARELVTQFVGRLKPELRQAMADGGPTHAIEVCASEAPKIADALSAESGWSVRRVSLRARNASRATPDQWERRALEEFDRRHAAGAAAQTIQVSATSGDRYRYMQAQGTEGVCLVCHGASPAPAVENVLQKYYPDDQATGYKMGQVRGAISLSHPL
jgi:hypothetical protein